MLNLGAGVQSTTIFLLSHEGLIPSIDHAIFADTQEEPRAVYEHLAWLHTVSAPVPLIHTGTVGRIGDDLARGVHTTGQRFASIPAFTAPGTVTPETLESMDCTPRKKRDKRRIGKLRRQCTKEYKTQVVERIIRREILGLKARQRMPKETLIVQLFGISTDEKRRAEKIRKRVAETGWAVAEFPLLDLGWSRTDCLAWLKDRVPHTVPRSACVFCPFKSALEWMATKNDPQAWARAVEVDAALRKPGAIASRGMDQPIYVHRSAIPLPMVDLAVEVAKDRAKKRRPLFEIMECGDGMCGM